MKCKSNGSVFCKKLLNPPQGKREPVVSVLNRFKSEEMLAASGQESVVLAGEVQNFPELSELCQTSCSCTGSFLHSYNKPLLVDSCDQCKTATSSS